MGIWRRSQDIELSSSPPETAAKGLLTHHDRFWLCAIGGVAVVASFAAARGLYGLLGCALALVSVSIAVIDRRHFVIPDELNGIGFLLGLCNAAIVGAPDVIDAILQAMLRGVCVAAVFLLIRFVYFFLRRREGIGLGDVKLAGVAGMWLSWTLIPVAVDMAAITALGLYFLPGRSFSTDVEAPTKLPFGLFFAPAIWVCWLLQQLYPAYSPF